MYFASQFFSKEVQGLIATVLQLSDREPLVHQQLLLDFSLPNSLIPFRLKYRCHGQTLEGSGFSCVSRLCETRGGHPLKAGLRAEDKRSDALQA